MHVKMEAAREHCDDDSALSLSSSSSSSSSSSASIVPDLSFSPARAAAQPRGLTFTELDWTTVEHRFDRLASARNGPEPVVKWSDFGYCIGKPHPQSINSVIYNIIIWFFFLLLFSIIYCRDAEITRDFWWDSHGIKKKKRMYSWYYKEGTSWILASHGWSSYKLKNSIILWHVINLHAPPFYFVICEILLNLFWLKF